MKKQLAILLTTSLLVGCGLNLNQREAAARFANASSDLGSFSEKELINWREVIIQMNSKDLAVGGTTAKLNDLDGAFDAEDIKARINAAVALSAYGNLLISLVDESQADNLKNAALQFSDSVKGVSGKALSDMQLESLGTVVYNIGGVFLEWQKAKAVKQIVLQSKTDVDHLCDLLIQDFDSKGMGLVQNIINTSVQLKDDADTALDSLKEQGASHTHIVDKLIAIEAYKLADDQKVRTKKVGGQIVESLKALKTANAELVNALENNTESLSDIKLLGVKLKDLGLALRLTGGY